MKDRNMEIVYNQKMLRVGQQYVANTFLPYIFLS